MKKMVSLSLPKWPSSWPIGSPIGPTTCFWNPSRISMMIIPRLRRHYFKSSLVEKQRHYDGLNIAFLSHAPWAFKSLRQIKPAIYKKKNTHKYCILVQERFYILHVAKE
mmetsp:Transcript_114895/g.225435  ORF Transcript_114895/g.225435 Transcript_114895/m.225435 type:complete len:109 (-) Transcript_114895:9-335(-)